jgi:LmbE family N-acetylglucosaminyl deacetylase
MNVLVIAAHPDAEVLGCGGTIARDSATHDVRIVILGEGISSRATSRAEASPTELDALKSDALAAGAALGARSVDLTGLPDNRFDEVPLLDVVKHVERWVDAYRPDVIYTHHPGDLNVDHGITFRAVMTATRPGASSHRVTDILAFEVASSTEWAFHRIGPAFQPNVFIDITSTLERKVDAMRRYRSERRAAPHPRCDDNIRAMAATRGAASGFTYAEAFELIRSLRR